MAANKEYLAKVLSSDGATLKRTLPDSLFRGPPSFTDVINGGQGQLDADLLLEPDDFGEGDTIDFDFVVEIYVTDDNYPNGQRIFKGVIQELEPYASKSQKGVRLRAMGLATTLTFDYYRVGGAYTFTKSGEQLDDVFKDIFDQHTADESLALVDYDGSSVEDPSVTITHEFSNQTWHQAATKCVEFAGEGWYWHVGPDGIARLKEKSSSADHTFILGKHIEFKAPKSAKKMYNIVRVVRSGGTAKDYSNVAAGNRRRLKILNDSGIGNEGTSDERGNTFLDENDTPKNKTQLTVYPSYNLESITPGDTCKIRNLKDGSTFFSDNMMIVAVRYSGDKAVLDVEEKVTDFGAELAEFVSEN